MKTITLTDEEVEILRAELFDIRECLEDSCECTPSAPLCSSCQELPILRGILAKL